MKNGKLLNLEQRLKQLEEEVRQLRTFIERHSKPKDWRSFVGVFAGDPVYEEIWRETEKLMEKDRRKGRRVPRSRAKVASEG